MGSNPVGVTTLGRLAQLGERLPYKQDVGSSILSSPTKKGCIRQGYSLLILYTGTAEVLGRCADFDMVKAEYPVLRKVLEVKRRSETIALFKLQETGRL